MEYVTKVSFGVTKNLGNYESLRIDLQGVVPLGESYENVLDHLRTQASIQANFHQSEYVDLLQKSRQIKTELAGLTSERDRLYEELKKLESIWNLIGVEIQSKFPSEIQALFLSYFSHVFNDLPGSEDDDEEVEVDPIPSDSEGSSHEF